MMDFGGAATMGGGGPMITGKWINTRTGEEVTVRDSFMDGEDMIIFLTDGRQLTLGDFQEFVQQSEEEYDERGNMLSNTNGGGIVKKASTDLPKPKREHPKVDAATVFAGMEEPKATVEPAPLQSDLDEIMKTVAEQDNMPPVEVNTRPTGEMGYSSAMKVINKTDAPNFSITVEWKDFPKNELQMCKDYFDTTDDDIAKVIISKYCTGHELEAAITEWLAKALKN